MCPKGCANRLLIHLQAPTHLKESKHSHIPASWLSFLFSAAYFSIPSFSLNCLINVHWARGCRLFFAEQSPAHCVRLRRITHPLKYTPSYETFALGTSPNNLKWTYIGLCLSWNPTLQLCVYSKCMAVSLGLSHHLARSSNLNSDPEIQSAAHSVLFLTSPSTEDTRTEDELTRGKRLCLFIRLCNVGYLNAKLHSHQLCSCFLFFATVDGILKMQSA